MRDFVGLMKHLHGVHEVILKWTAENLLHRHVLQFAVKYCTTDSWDIRLNNSLNAKCGVSGSEHIDFHVLNLDLYWLAFLRLGHILIHNWSWRECWWNFSQNFSELLKLSWNFSLWQNHNRYAEGRREVALFLKVSLDCRGSQRDSPSSDKLKPSVFRGPAR